MPREIKQINEISETIHTFWRRVLIVVGFVTTLKVLFMFTAAH